MQLCIDITTYVYSGLASCSHAHIAFATDSQTQVFQPVIKMQAAVINTYCSSTVILKIVLLAKQLYIRNKPHGITILHNTCNCFGIQSRAF